LDTLATVTSTLPIELAMTLMPPIKLEALDGELINLSMFDDSPLVINLWATWSLPCRREMPLIIPGQTT
jgi:thiol-disulfide isomerase/thioredoxin